VRSLSLLFFSLIPDSSRKAQRAIKAALPDEESTDRIQKSNSKQANKSKQAT